MRTRGGCVNSTLLIARIDGVYGGKIARLRRSPG
jgi:hypothetical protein